MPDVPDQFSQCLVGYRHAVCPHVEPKASKTVTLARVTHLADPFSVLFGLKWPDLARRKETACPGRLGPSRAELEQI